MKSASDPRHQIRRKVLQQLFASSYDLKGSANIELSETTKKILVKLPEINSVIETAAPEWPIDKINKVDLSILQLATWELMEAKVPPKAIIDEAIELAKEF